MWSVLEWSRRHGVGPALVSHAWEFVLLTVQAKGADKVLLEDQPLWVPRPAPSLSLVFPALWPFSCLVRSR